jgi:hypothetical protein
MNFKKIFFIGIASLMFFVTSRCDSVVTEENCKESWVRKYESTFVPDWNMLASVARTRDFFLSRGVAIPESATFCDEDSSISYVLSDGIVTLFCNGIMRTIFNNSITEFVDYLSSEKIVLHPETGLSLSHLDKTKLNSCTMSIQDDGLVCKSIKTFDDGRVRVNSLINLADGYSTTFEWLDDGRMIVRESTGTVEVVPSLEKFFDEVIHSHSMLTFPDGNFFTSTGIVLRDGSGVSCYGVDGMKFHLLSKGPKVRFFAPSFGAKLEGVLSGGKFLTTWKLDSSSGSYKFARLGEADVLVDEVLGHVILYVDFSLMSVGIFLYDGLGHYCKRNGAGSVRYGKMNQSLFGDDVFNKAFNSPRHASSYQHLFRSF